MTPKQTSVADNGVSRGADRPVSQVRSAHSSKTQIVPRQKIKPGGNRAADDMVTNDPCLRRFWWSEAIVHANT